MRDWLRHVWQFIIAVVRQWGVLVTGGFVVALIGVIEHLSGRSVSGWPLWSALILSLIAAVFSAWRKERQNWERLGGLSTFSVTPKEMVSVYKGRTTAQGEILAKNYNGKWIKVHGPVQDIRITNFPLIWFENVDVILTTSIEEPGIHMTFSRRWISRFAVLQKGDIITVLGKIRYVSTNHIKLKWCELLDVGTRDIKEETRNLNRE